MAPTARRELKEFGESAAGAFKPLVEAGEWMADHPQVITGTLAGITSAMAAFKAVKAASALPKLLMSVSGVLGAMAGGSRRTLPWAGSWGSPPQ